MVKEQTDQHSSSGTEPVGRLDALIALISGSALAAFVGLVAYAVLAAVGVLNASSATARIINGYGDPAIDVLPAGNEAPASYQPHAATLAGAEVTYLDFGDNTALTTDGTVTVAPIWVFIDGFDVDGLPQIIDDHPSLLDVNIGDDGYSDLWDVQYVLVPEGLDSRAIQSLADLTASGLDTVPAGTLVNCPLVDASATTSEGHQLRSGWLRGELVHYFALGRSSTAPGDIYEFIRSDGDLVSVPPLIVLPDGEGPQPQFFRLHLVTVRTDREATAVHSPADLAPLGFEVHDTGRLLNHVLLLD